MKELRTFLGEVLSAKRELKEVYYRTRNKDTKADLKELVAAAIGIQTTAKELLDLRAKSKVARQVLNDRKATLSLKKWKSGLPKRIKDFKKKSSKLPQEHLTKFQDQLLKYMNEISTTLNDWIIDIETLTDLPEPPK
jgi:aldehyde:ferredoxin oxidoreductase